MMLARQSVVPVVVNADLLSPAAAASGLTVAARLKNGCDWFMSAADGPVRADVRCGASAARAKRTHWRRRRCRRKQQTGDDQQMHGDQ